MKWFTYGYRHSVHILLEYNPRGNCRILDVYHSREDAELAKETLNRNEERKFQVLKSSCYYVPIRNTYCVIKKTLR